jgi:hypothetical protein
VQNWGEGIVPAFAGRGLALLHDAWRLWRLMRELLVRGKNTIDPEVIDPGGRSVEDSPVKSDFTFTLRSHFVKKNNSYTKAVAYWSRSRNFSANTSELL